MAEGVEFEEQDPQPRYASAPSQGSGITSFLIRKGFAHTEAQANGILMAVAAVAILAAGFILFGPSDGRNGPPNAAERAELEASTKPKPRPHAR
jgi:hypothetical protein